MWTASVLNIEEEWERERKPLHYHFSPFPRKTTCPPIYQTHLPPPSSVIFGLPCLGLCSLPLPLHFPLFGMAVFSGSTNHILPVSGSNVGGYNKNPPKFSCFLDFLTKTNVFSILFNLHINNYVFSWLLMIYFSQKII